MWKLQKIPNKTLRQAIFFSFSHYLFSQASSFYPRPSEQGSGQQQLQGRQRVLRQRVWEGWVSNCTQQQRLHLMAWPRPALQEEHIESVSMQEGSNSGPQPLAEAFSLLPLMPDVLAFSQLLCEWKHRQGHSATSSWSRLFTHRAGCVNIIRWNDTERALFTDRVGGLLSWCKQFWWENDTVSMLMETRKWSHKAVNNVLQ